MDTSVLEEFGLSKGEIKIYLALLESGETKVGFIIEKSGMASSAVHNSLNTLLEKGLVSYIKKGKIKHYKAVSPGQLLNFIENKKKRILEILPELELKQKKSEEKQEAEIFEGTKGIIAMLNLIIKDVKKGDDYLFFAVNVNEHNKEIQDFFSVYDIKRKEKGLIINGLAKQEFKAFFIKRKFLKMRYTNLPIPSNISLCNNRVALFSWEDRPIGYLIESKQIADIFRNFFYEVWNKTK